MFDRILNSPLYQLFSQNYCLYVLMNLINIFHHISSNSVLRTIKSMWPYVQHICVITKIIIVFPNHVFLYGELKLDAKHMTKNEIKHKWSVSVSSEHIGKYAWIQPTLTPPEISKNTFFYRTPAVAASFLTMPKKYCMWMNSNFTGNQSWNKTFLLVSGIDVEKSGSFNVKLILFMNNFYKNIFRSSRLQMFFKIDALKSFGNFTGKHLSWSLFLKNLLAEGFQLY